MFLTVLFLGSCSVEVVEISFCCMAVKSVAVDRARGEWGLKR